MNSELTFRLAQTSDFDEILKLSEGVYDGQDYLPLRFHKWMQMINVAVMLAHTSGKLIGLVQCSVVDDGRTAVRRAARISPEFRGQGVYKRLSEAMNEFVRRHYPAVQREMFTSTMCHFPAREITEMRSIRTSAVNKSLFALDSLKVNFSDQVEPCMKEYLCDVIFTSPFARRLFPYNSIILDWIPMEPLRSNIDHFQHEIGHEFYFAVDKCGGDAIPRSVSFGVLSPRVGCPVWSVTIYTSDPTLYEAHVMHQLQHAFEVADGDFFISFIQDKSLSKEGRRLVRECLPQVEFDEAWSTFFLCENSIPRGATN
ncbi:histidine N-acetyltransferase-like [Stylophora pistillata]|uniref:histidine N-acetyltransferase-like n=1 Tax=Stylophora pistillata TaxID=50429 RepID=UPI000C03986F|nr:histidine N-acetyltransferase-like [Stylophora pistillata]